MLLTLQLVDIANGLKYMHELRVVHGDLKGVHISIESSTLALLTRVQRRTS